MNSKNLFIVGIIGYFATALTYIFSLLFQPLSYDYIFKTAPDVIAAMMILVYAAQKNKALLVGAFLACGLGDLLLGIDRTHYFMPALVSYLVGHSVFAVAFWRDKKMSQAALLRCGGVVAYTLGIGIYLLPQAGALALPVLVYLLAIGTMAAAAAFRDAPRMQVVFIGSCLFMVGDSLIAIDKFALALPHSLPIIVSIYYTAIFCLLMGLVTRPGSLGVGIPKMQR